MTIRPLESVPPTETLEIENGLTLVSRVKLLLTIDPSNPSSATTIDEWKLKRALIEYLKTNFSVPITVPEEDLYFKRIKDLKKRKRQDPVAHGTLFIRDLVFLNNNKKNANLVEGKVNEEDAKVLEKKFLEWRSSIVKKMDGMELNLEGLKFKLGVALPHSDDFDGMKREWEELNAFGNRGYARAGRQQPDTIVLRGVPSRWFAEPRVSSKPSMLVTHTIFSSFGKIRNLNVAEDDDLGKDANKDSGDIVSGLNCKIVVQFERYNDFYNAMRVLSGRSLQKQGSRLRADYEVTWDNDGFFRNSRSFTQEKSSAIPERGAGQYRSEAARRYSPDNMRSKRYREE